jgi:hypothetical protein
MVPWKLINGFTGLKRNYLDENEFDDMYEMPEEKGFADYSPTFKFDAMAPLDPTFIF